MCGIAGFWGEGNPPNEGRIRETMALMRNRGPDSQSYAQYLSGQTHCLLLHSRLSILDLDPRSNQPFERGALAISFNGEIYNYRELGDKVGDLTTESDTEVLIALLEKYGASAALDLCEGMWAFALFDRSSGELTLSRDRFGEKPLFFWPRPEGVYFASETRFLWALAGEKAEPNLRQIKRQLINGYRSLFKRGETYYECVREVPAGGVLRLKEPGQSPDVARYYRPFICSPRSMTEQEAVEGIRERLCRSVELRLRADVPVAFCLSGGVDSGGLCSIASRILKYPVTAYSIIDPDPRYDESQNIDRIVADLGCRNNKIELKRSASLERLREQIHYHDAPIATISYYVHSLISEAISRDGYKVAVSGTGADELLTGYYDHFLMHLAEVAGTDLYAEGLKNWETQIKPVVRNPLLSRPELFKKGTPALGHLYPDADRYRREYLLDGFEEDFAQENFCRDSLRNRMLNELFYEVVPVILREDDLNSMQYSVENRSPYLDRELVEFCYTIPTPLLISQGYGKYLLRQALAGVLCDEVRLDRQKRGFNASIESLFDLDSPEFRAELLSDGPLYEFVRRERVEELLSRRGFDNSESKFLFNLINAKLFLNG
jgi:asparagine synthase (glutamine-hydrolysing)